MQFPNGVNKSNLIKLGVLAGAYYLMKGKKSNPSANNNNAPVVVDNDNAATEDKNKSLTPFQLGKELADKVLGRKA